LRLVSLEGLPVAEADRRLGLTPSQVWTRYHRAKVKLDQFLQHQEKFSEKFKNPSELAQSPRLFGNWKR